MKKMTSSLHNRTSIQAAQMTERLHASDNFAESLHLRGSDDGQPDLPSGGHAALPRGGQRHYLV
jgi:hypothetical protein